MPKIIVIGLDGATLDLIEPWAKEGKLPVLSSLMARGAYCRLQSVLPVLSSAAWSSFMTGMNPGKHGLYDFVKRAPGSYHLRPVNHQHIHGKTLWRIISEQSMKVIVMNVPMTYPPEPVNGILVSGLGTPDYQTFTYPPDMSKLLLQQGYQVNSKVQFRPGTEREYLQEVSTITNRLTNAALQLLKAEEWDFFMVVYREPDEMAHFFWRFMDPDHPLHPAESENPYQDAILNYYRSVDEAIGRIVRAGGDETNIIIMSDHGTGPFFKDVLLNEWLRQKGWLALNKDDELKNISRRALQKVGLTRSNVSSTLRRMKLGRLERLIKRTLGDRIEILPVSTRTEFPDAIDWRHTRAYSFGYHGQIYINLIGREPEGIVAPGEEYDHLCEEIREALMALVDPEDGKPVVDQVVHRSQAFQGPATNEAPDLIVIMRKLSYITRSGYEFGNQAGEIFTPPHQYQSGSHRMDGTLIMAGPGVRQAGYQGESASLVDMAPTVLYLLGNPVPDNMDGSVLTSWLSSKRSVEYVQADPQAIFSSPTIDALTPEQEAEMVQRLKDLGYLD